MEQNIAVLGPAGTFSDSACQKYQQLCTCPLQPVYYPTIDETFHAVGKECVLGIVPVENTLDGYVQRSLDLLLEMDLKIIREISVPVQFSLVANTENVDEIKTLYVQFKSSGQCRRQIDSLSGVKLVITESNMESFYLVQQGKSGEAAIIPQHMLSQSNAKFQIENVTDSSNNVTRFLVIQPGGVLEQSGFNEIKVSLYVMPQIDEPGVLFRILKIFNDHQVNLVSIMSRPTKRNMGTYNFYLELNGIKEQKADVFEALYSLKKQIPVKVLGIY